MDLSAVSLAERPALASAMQRLHHEGWPPFMHASASAPHWRHLYGAFARYQVALCDERGEALAAGFMAPLGWDGTEAGLPAGWDAALAVSVREHAAGQRPTALVALAAFVGEAQRAQGLSRALLRAMVAHAAWLGLSAVVVPVRPTLKSRYPLTPMARYVHWHEHGAPFDPWLRTHWRLGGELLHVAPRSKVVVGTVAEWEQWTAMRFPESGLYVVPEALQPIEIQREADWGRYEEPNVWVRHRVEQVEKGELGIHA